jgi:hypothetical protein
MCGNPCSKVTDVEVVIDPDPRPKVSWEPKATKKKQPDPPSTDDIKDAVKKEFQKRMDGGCEKGCICRPLPGSQPTPVDRTAPAEPFEPFTVYIPDLAPDASAPTNDNPSWVVRGKFKVKYKAQPGMCEPNMNVRVLAPK